MDETTINEAVRIRAASEDDVPLLLQMIGELAAYEKLTGQVSTTEGLLRKNLFGTEPAAEALIAEYNGEAAGFAIYFKNFSTFVGKSGLYIEDLFIRPEFRCRGIGALFMRRFAELAKQRGYERIEWAVLDWNPARGFYEHIGARPLSSWILYRLAGEQLDSLAG